MNSAFADVPSVAIGRIIQHFCTYIIVRVVLVIVEVILTSFGVLTLIARAVTKLSSRMIGYRSKPSQLATLVASTPSQITSPRGAAPITTFDRTASGQDANAGAVGMIRYLGAGMPHLFPTLDPNLRRFEHMFMSPIVKLFMAIVEILPFCAICTVLYEGGPLAARATLMDHLMTEFLTAKDVKQAPKSPVTRSSVASGLSLPTTLDAASLDQEKQVIILGAGFDSRAYRLSQMRSPNVHVIEVDQSSVQETKKHRLSKSLSPDELKELKVEFVACNFEHEGALFQALSNSRTFDPLCRTFILWEGVTYYLPIAAVENTLSTLCALRRSGGATELAEWTLVFDFADDAAFNQPLRVFQRLNWAALSLINHPCKSCLNFDNMEEFMARFGIVVREKHTASQLIAQYFPHLGVTKNMLGLSIGCCQFA